MLVTIVAGARPNFIKIAPIIRAIESAQYEGFNINYRLIHTGQHYDKKMSEKFFEQLGIPDPDRNLGCGGGTQAEQTAAIMIKFEQELLDNKPDIVMVVGDVTSTMACTITAKKLGIDVAHIEAGIRSGDMSMPEEINRMVTDSICDYYFTTTQFANNQLIRQQVPEYRIHLVGNTMIDSLYQNLDRIIEPKVFQQSAIQKGNYFLLTLHRPSNVDDGDKLTDILQNISEATQGLPVIFPVHPRTKTKLDECDFQDSNLVLIDPEGYLEFIYLVKYAKAVITDSGGITEEATVLDVPCLTLRNSTERPETILQGTNELIGDNYDKLKNCLAKILNGQWKKSTPPRYWDGYTSERIISVLTSLYLTTGVREKVY